jgi:hypothetical protein
MKKNLTISLIGIAVVAIAAAGVFNPLRKSEEKIKHVLLQTTPLGTSKSEVRSVADKKRWLDGRYAGTTGFLKQETGKDPQVIGVTSLRGHLGSYREFPIPLRADVTAFWAFDGGGRLVDVWVWKTTDAP